MTVIPANGMWPIYDLSPDPAMVLHHIAHGMVATGHSGGSHVPESFQQVLIVSPVIARMVAQLLPSKEAFKKHLFENARVPLDFYPPYRHEPSRRRLADLGIAVRDERVPICERWEDFLILCAGGEGGLHSCGLSTMLGWAVTRKIE